MKKKLSDLTREDICGTCDKYSVHYTVDCNTACPFYIGNGWCYRHKRKIEITNCKTNYNYIKRHPNEEVEF